MSNNLFSLVNYSIQVQSNAKYWSSVSYDVGESGVGGREEALRALCHRTP
ncbi:MAG: hypothetical protein LBT53_05240 [Puniceicoccales bacterium]|jgi:hypothetical protein|nr:hypothetical protein [Puniceicoccales bacterium]